MTRQLTSATTLDNLKKEAKRWLKALRAGDAEARARLRRAYPSAPAEPGLRDVQHALAREHGLPGWIALKDALADFALASRAHAERVAWFLENACPDHHVRGGPDHVMARHTAMRILSRHPEIARDSLYTAVVCGELAEVERILSERPEAASEKSSATSDDRAEAGAAVIGSERPSVRKDGSRSCTSASHGCRSRRRTTMRSPLPAPCWTGARTPTPTSWPGTAAILRSSGSSGG